VDDCPDTTGSLAMLLRAWGHGVEVARNGAEALAIAADRPVGVVLLDIGMPGMSGWDLARRLRTQPGTRGAMLVALSGYGDADARRRSWEAGCHLHITKPADPAVLERLLAVKSKESFSHVS
jgi:CheY-like chemotaxis protein